MSSRALTRLGQATVFVVASLAIFLPILVLKPVIGPLDANAIQVAVTFVAWLFLRRYSGRSQKENDFGPNLARALFAVSAGLLVASLGNLERYGFSPDTAFGLALAKLVDAAIVVSITLLALAWQGVTFDRIFLEKGRLVPGLLIGVATFAGMVALGLGRPGNEEMPHVLRTHWPAVTVFVLSNAVAEEIMFRGVFLKWLREHLGAWGGVLVTSLVFAIAHLGVQYQSTEQMVGFLAIVFILGCLWAALMLWTRSVLASVLFHAGADVVFMTEIFKGHGI